ncbi:MAG: serine O-acetyltransferase [Deltaproteobacteria bacterium]|nr:serine O-acetyltransferase [Deltaproteobacteria bacterium]
MFGAALLFRLQTFFYEAGWPSLAWMLNVTNRMIYLVSIGRDVRADGGFYIAHGHVVIDGQTTFGRNVSVGPFVTLGLNTTVFDFRGPTLGDDVFIGTGAKLLGPIRVGHRARIGANAVVVSDVPDDHTAVGVPARAQPSHASSATRSEDAPRVVSLRS